MHGMSKTRFYKIFYGIKRRCTEESFHSSKYYVEKGIKNEWATFDEFSKDMVDSYLRHVQEFGEKQTTIDRIDSNGNYCKENCRWATYKQQGCNFSNNVNVTLGGLTKHLSQWCEDLGLKKPTIFSRVNKMGMSPLEALSFYKNMPVNNYTICPDCGVTRNITLAPGCPVCFDPFIKKKRPTLKIKRNDYKRGQDKKIKK